MTLDPRPLIETDLLSQMGFDSMPEEKQEQILTLLVDAVRDRVLVRIHDALDEGTQTTWHQVLETEDDTIISNFLQENSINYPALVTEEALQVKNDILEKVGQNATMASSDTSEAPQAIPSSQ